MKPDTLNHPGVQSAVEKIRRQFRADKGHRAAQRRKGASRTQQAWSSGLEPPLATKGEKQ